MINDHDYVRVHTLNGRDGEAVEETSRFANIGMKDGEVKIS